ncbi:fungal-specific transcription factor domain-containing protein [Paraphoma chrysanthemicola]|nr:fungal-specific transcription factor domain-containing protein [Paraphoma chrysanthemicola]
MTVEPPRTDPEQQTNTQEDGSRSNVNDLGALIGSHSTSFDQYIGRLPHADISYLASKGVFELPPKLVQDELLDAYFLYIHPFLPVLNEEKLRNDYTSGLQATGLLLYRAIMFAATSYLKQSSVVMCGFSSVIEAQTTHFERARLLFDFNVEAVKINRLQTLLMFSYWVPTIDIQYARGNNYWLSGALAIAKDLNLNKEEVIARAEPQSQKSMRRTWWACVVRDSILAFTYRRPPLINPHDYNVEKLVVEDLTGDYHASAAWQGPSRDIVARLFIHQTDLATLAYKHLHAMYSPGQTASSMISTPASLMEHLLNVDRWNTELQLWKQTFLAEDLSCLELGEDIYRCLIMHRNFVLVMYNTISMIVNQPRSQIIGAALKLWSGSVQTLLQSSWERTSTAASENIDAIEELVRLGLTKNLHISLSSMLAYAAMIKYLNHLLQSSSATVGKDASTRLCFHALEAMQTRFPVVGALIQTVNAAAASLDASENEQRGIIDSQSPGTEYMKKRLLAIGRATSYFEQAMMNDATVPATELSPSTLLQNSPPSV